jgi:hypothetical protein
MLFGTDSQGFATHDRRHGRPRLAPRPPTGRLTLSSGSPVPSSSRISWPTLYFAPHLGNAIDLYDTTMNQWVPRSFSEISVAVPSTLFRLFDIFAYWDGDSVALEMVNWNQSTGSITAATAATPSVITSAGHGLSNGNLVGPAGLNNTVGTDATNGLNGTVWRVANVTANTFEAEGSQCAALVASTTGTWYKVPNSEDRGTALTTQDGRYTKDGDASRLYLGTGITTDTSGRCDQDFGGSNSPPSWLLCNYYNRQPFVLFYRDTTDSWTYTTATNRPANGRGKLARIGFVVGVQEEQIDAEAVHAATDDSVVNGSTTVATDIGLDTFTTNNSTRSGVISAQGVVNPMIARYRTAPSAGFHFLGWEEVSDGAGGGTTTWYGDAALTVPISGIMARWRA